MYSKELVFNSPEQTYIRDLTPDVQRFVEETKTESGLAIVMSRHTTMGLTVFELDERKLLDDVVLSSKMLVPEDSRSTWVTAEYKSSFPVTDQFTHNCMDNPRRDPEEVDKDHNAARHIRALLFSRHEAVVPIQEYKLVLGRYQQIAAFEFDGRDGLGENPLRRRIVQVIIDPSPIHILPPVELT